MKKLFVLLLCSLSLSCHYFAKKKESFRVIQVVSKNLTKYVEANGSVEASSIVEIYSPVSGRVEKIFIKEGDHIEPRQQIALISSDARSFFLDTAASKGKKELDYWKKQIQLTPILAPTSGKVISLKAELDDKVSGVIAQISKGEIIRANVDEADLPSIKLGQRVVIRFDIASDAQLTGTLSKISETSKLVNNVNVYSCEVSLPSPEKQKSLPFDVKMGMSVTLNFPVEEKKNATALPVDAVDGKSLTTVTLLRENDEKTKVNLGQIYGDWVEIVAGLNVGDKIKVPKFKLNQDKRRKSPLMIRRE